MALLSSKEKDMLNLFDSYGIRIDGRNFYSSRAIFCKKDLYSYCLSSISIQHDDSIIDLSLKGEAVDLGNFEIKLSYEPKPKDDKITAEVISTIDRLLVKKLRHEDLFPKTQENSWKFFIDIFSTKVIELSDIQLIVQGIKFLLYEAQIPKVVSLVNQFNGQKEFALSNSQTFSQQQNRVQQSILSEADQVTRISTGKLLDLYLFGVGKYNLLLDPCKEEISIMDSFILMTCTQQGTIIDLEAIGTNLDLRRIEELNRFVASVYITNQ